MVDPIVDLSLTLSLTPCPAGLRLHAPQLPRHVPSLPVVQVPRPRHVQVHRGRGQGHVPQRARSDVQGMPVVVQAFWGQALVDVMLVRMLGAH